MAKKVRYNGGTLSYYGCSDPTNLVVGKEYEVVLSKDRGWQTDYTLKGIYGEFNSVWFDEVSSDDKVYMAIAHEVPVIGEKYSCYKMEFMFPFLIGKVLTIEITTVARHQLSFHSL